MSDSPNFKTPMEPKQKTALQLVGVVVFMASLAWASVPLYDWFCKVTGWGGETNVASAAPEQALEQTIKIRFDASTESGMEKCHRMKRSTKKIESRFWRACTGCWKNPTRLVSLQTAESLRAA